MSEKLLHRIKAFEEVWQLYPNRQGKKAALRHFRASVKTVDDLSKIIQALGNYLGSGNVKRGLIKNGSTWFNEWQDWVEPSDVMMLGSGIKVASSQQQAKEWVNK